MHAVKIIMRKELADHFSSYRFVILFALIFMVSLITGTLKARIIQSLHILSSSFKPYL